ncbi:MAG: hypothetical protein CVT73_24700 [Alphaproteobacteria bacterium HGW-Alphaproteobacteria-12]|nr:MAG: hypothetical protein CVT73_24700 [Alphaproteobacteria bacterium HGW-Alphaproteobacteria-12]
MRRVLLHVMLPVLALGALAGCAVLEAAFPRTAEGFRQGGIVGAIGGFAEGVLTVCGTLDGEEVRLLVDVTAAEFGAGDGLAHVREMRMDACRKVGAVSALIDGVAVPLIEAHNPPD